MSAIQHLVHHHLVHRITSLDGGSVTSPAVVRKTSDPAIKNKYSLRNRIFVLEYQNLHIIDL